MRKFKWAAALTAAFALAGCVEKPGPEVEPEDEYVVLEHLEAGYYGDYYKSGTNNYFLQVYNGEVDKDGYFTGDYTSITVDMFTDKSVVMDIPDGIYLPTFSRKAFEFDKGVDITVKQHLINEAALMSKYTGYSYTWQDIQKMDNISDDRLGELMFGDGAEFAYKKGLKHLDRAITDGSIAISHEGSVYTFLIDITVAGKEYHFKYVGSLNIQNLEGSTGPSVDPEPEPEPEPGPTPDTFTGTYAQITNYGENWGGASPGYNLFSILAYESETSSGGAFVEVDLICPVGDTIPDGTYQVVAPVAKNIKPGVAVGYYSEYGYSLGCWFGYNKGVVYEGNSGSATVSHPGGKFKLEFTMTDTSLKKTYSGVLTEGKIQYFDYR